MRVVSGALALVALLARQAPAQALPAGLQPAVERIDAMARAELARENVGSVTVGLVSGADLVWTQSYGYADIERKVPASKESIYRIGSTTKQFTALMLLQLAEAGRVRLSDPVEKHFPEVNLVQGRIATAPPITLVQLATMTSGLDREPDDLARFLRGAVVEWEKVLIAALPRTRYRSEPDTQYFYSNIGYAILGAALGRAAGTAFVDYVQQRIFAPLGMTDTAFEPGDRIRDRIAKGYELGRDGKLDAETPAREHAGRGYKVPNGAIYTNVADLARFVAFELGAGPDQVLPRKALEQNLARVSSASGNLSSGYGIGFMAARHGEFVAYGHGGSVAGYHASALFDPVSKTGAIVLRNVGGRFDASGLCLRALQEAAAAKRKPPRS